MSMSFTKANLSDFDWLIKRCLAEEEELEWVEELLPCRLHWELRQMPILPTSVADYAFPEMWASLTALPTSIRS